MASPTIADLFDGNVAQREYSSPSSVEFVNAARTVVVVLTVEQTFRFEGLSETQAKSTADVSVTDVGGTQYTVPFKQSFSDGSTGYAIAPKEQVEIQRERMSPRLWRVTVTRRGSKAVRYYGDGTTSTIFSAPLWAQSFI